MGVLTGAHHLLFSHIHMHTYIIIHMCGTLQTYSQRHTIFYSLIYICICIYLYICDSQGHTTGWRRPIGCLKLQDSFRKRATNYRAVLREMTFKDKVSDGSSPHIICLSLTYSLIYICIFIHSCICVCLHLSRWKKGMVLLLLCYAYVYIYIYVNMHVRVSI